MSTVSGYHLEERPPQHTEEVNKQISSKVKKEMNLEAKKLLLSHIDDNLTKETENIGQKVLIGQRIEPTFIHKQTTIAKMTDLPEKEFQISEKVDRYITKCLAKKYTFDLDNPVFGEMTPEMKLLAFAQMEYAFGAVETGQKFHESELIQIKDRIEVEMQEADDIVLSQATRGMPPDVAEKTKTSIKNAIYLLINAEFDGDDRLQYRNLTVSDQLSKLGKSIDDIKLISDNLEKDFSDIDLARATKLLSPENAEKMKGAIKRKVDDLIGMKYESHISAGYQKLSLPDKIHLLETSIDELTTDYAAELGRFISTGSFASENELKMDMTSVKTETCAKQKIEKWGVFKEITRGKAKVVWLDTSKIAGTHAYYTPVKAIFNSKEKEIKAEVETTTKIKKRLSKSDTANLALTMDVVAGKDKIDGKYTIRTDKAIGDLENSVRKNDLNFSDSIKISKEIVKGMYNLQKADFVSGDPKLENVLIYQDPVTHIISAKISDFGKSKEVLGDSQRLYTGNSRFAPPEMTLSKKGEVYSTAIMVIRVLEGAFLDKDHQMLIAPTNIDDTVIDKKREGIERFLMKNRDCPQTEASSSLAKVKIYGRGFTIFARLASVKELRDAENEVKNYINALRDKLVEKSADNQEKINALCELLIKMTKSDPKARCSLEEAEKIYSALTFA